MNKEELDKKKEELNVLCAEFYKGVADKFLEHFTEMEIGTAEALIPQVEFQITYLGALVRYASVLAVDSGVDGDLFAKIAKESWDQSYAAAPKFS